MRLFGFGGLLLVVIGTVSLYALYSLRAPIGPTRVVPAAYQSDALVSSLQSNISSALQQLAELQRRLDIQRDASYFTTEKPPAVSSKTEKEISNLHTAVQSLQDRIARLSAQLEGKLNALEDQQQAQQQQFDHHKQEQEQQSQQQQQQQQQAPVPQQQQQSPPPPPPPVVQASTPDTAPEKSRVKLLIAVTTSFSTKGEGLRTAIRETWVHYKTPWEGDWAYQFFLGYTNETERALAAAQEARLHDDMVFLPFLDTYDNLTLKTMNMARWAVEHYDFDYMLKLDDDTYLRLDKYIEKLAPLAPTKLYAGFCNPSFRPNRPPEAWGLTREEYPSDSGPAWCQGYIYTISYDLAKWIAEEPKPLLKLEDINTALIADKHGVKTTWMSGIHNIGCYAGMFAGHYTEPKDFHRYFKNTQEDPNGDICR